MAKIPKFKSDKEAAEFWDKHDLTDYVDDLKMAKDIVFVKPETQTISLRIDRKVVNLIKAMSRKYGIGYSSLIRMWILEKVRSGK